MEAISPKYTGERIVSRKSIDYREIAENKFITAKNNGQNCLSTFSDHSGFALTAQATVIEILSTDRLITFTTLSYR